MQVGEVDPVLLGHLLAGDAGGAQEALDGLLRRADAGAFALLAPVGLGRGQPLGHQRQAPWAGKRGQRLGQQPLGRQLLPRHPLQIPRRLRLHARRDLFAKEFKQ